MAKAIMIQGTASGVGKTILTLALCRIFKEDGVKVCPFKPQNITSNTYFTPSGDEMAISQWLQAKAAGIIPDSLMSPVVLKPSANGVRAIVNGKPLKDVNLYNSLEVRKELLPTIVEAYNQVSSDYEVIVIEGAGSPVELNLNQNDMVNMGMASIARSPVLLVSDIDRGGVFASLYGTIHLLDEIEKEYVKATIVNRFIGDVATFQKGIEIMEEITKVPVAGVVPAMKINLPEEDGPDHGLAVIIESASDNERESIKRNNLKSVPVVMKDNTIDDEKSFSGKNIIGLEAEFDYIAKVVRKALNMELIVDILNKGM